jgi:hypothetical protein
VQARFWRAVAGRCADSPAVFCYDLMNEPVVPASARTATGWGLRLVDDLNFISVHIYPKTGKVKEALDTLAGFAVGRPVLIEETFPLACSPRELEEFIEASRKHAAGWIGFYWGKPPEELRRSKKIADALTLRWLELFQRRARK